MIRLKMSVVNNTEVYIVDNKEDDISSDFQYFGEFYLAVYDS
jgi:hypothetical protein